MGGVRRWGLLSASMSNDQGEVVGEEMQLNPIKHPLLQRAAERRRPATYPPPSWDGGDVIGTIRAQLKLLRLLGLNPLSDGK